MATACDTIIFIVEVIIFVFFLAKCESLSMHWVPAYTINFWVRVNQRIRFLPNANDFPPVSAGKLGEGKGS